MIRPEPGESADAAAWLVGVAPERGVTLRLEPGRTRIGADAACEVVISDDAVSGLHASIRWTGEDFLLTDLDSTNGTTVNGDDVRRRALADGDRVGFGSSEWIFKCVRFDGP